MMMVRRSIISAVHLKPVSAYSPMPRGTARWAVAKALELRHFIHELVRVWL
jgi:hypothetical protein